MEKKLKIIIGVLSAVILVLAGVLIYQLSKKTEIKETVQVLTVDKENLTGKVLAIPTSEDLDYELQYNLIVEFYSK